MRSGEAVPSESLESSSFSQSMKGALSRMALVSRGLGLLAWTMGGGFASSLPSSLKSVSSCLCRRVGESGEAKLLTSEELNRCNRSFFDDIELEDVNCERVGTQVDCLSGASI